MQSSTRDSSGFSLIELIVVVAVMAVLIGVITPEFYRYVEKSKRSVDLKQARTMAEVFDIIKATQDIALVNGYDCIETWNVDQAAFFDYDTYVSGSVMMYRVFAQMGGVPVSRVNKDYFFTVIYNENGIRAIYLDELPLDMKTKLYPDDGSFYRNGFKE
ncbi:MAG: prepilin-type N-terminal cleavage/methylation domain-containing protein [Lachnospiraceae bacterium]|nr:prepilin-type N-terminal cleavage/methylation domain-containing protein [Lachnospiraceae bacterium]